MRPPHACLLSVFLLVGAGPPLAGQGAGATSAICVVDRIVDGDTFYCRGGLKIRLLGMDSPERGQGEIARQAGRALRRVLPPARPVGLEFDVQVRDRYGRTLAYVWAGDTLVNEWMVREGWAVRYTVPPNVRYAGRIAAAERDARGKEKGLWGESQPWCMPLTFRRGDCRDRE